MKTEQVNIRLETQLLATIEKAAGDEYLERGTMIRKLVLMGLKQYRLDRTMADFQARKISTGYAAQELGISVGEMIDLARNRGISYPLDPVAFRRRLRRTFEKWPAVAERSASPYGGAGAPTASASLPDRPPRPGGILFIGINPAIKSAQAGHYYQGKIGQGIWRRLKRVGLLAPEVIPGSEDDSFVARGNGLTDVVKRATSSAVDLNPEELISGARLLREKIARWRPSMVVFAFKLAAVTVTGSKSVRPGPGPDVDGVPTYLFAGPYASKRDVEANEDGLRSLLSKLGRVTEPDLQTQRITDADIEAGIVRLPRDAKRLFPERKGAVAIVIRGEAMSVPYDPRAPKGGKERSGVLRIGRRGLSRVNPGEKLRLSRSAEGSICMD